MKCPLCKGKLSYIKAQTDSGGGYGRAYVVCDCGFSYEPPGKPVGRVSDESGWDQITRDIKEKEILLKNMFKGDE